MSTLGRRVLAISSTVDVISGECDASEELARWCLVVVDVVVARFAIGRLPVGAFIDIAFLLLFLTFSFQAADEIVFNLERGKHARKDILRGRICDILSISITSTSHPCKS